MHLSLMRNADKSKLSKRKNPTSISVLCSSGLPTRGADELPRTVLHPDRRRRGTADMDELIANFDPENLSKAGAIFDIQKLDWLNGRWLREKLSEEEFLGRVKTWAMQGDRLLSGLKLAQSRVQTFGELPDLTGFLLKSDLGLQASNFDGLKKLDHAACLEIHSRGGPGARSHAGLDRGIH
jgi:glutamyl-tRNA synthetase